MGLWAQHQWGARQGEHPQPCWSEEGRGLAAPHPGGCLAGSHSTHTPPPHVPGTAPHPPALPPLSWGKGKPSCSTTCLLRGGGGLISAQSEPQKHWALFRMLPACGSAFPTTPPPRPSGVRRGRPERGGAAARARGEPWAGGTRWEAADTSTIPWAMGEAAVELQQLLLGGGQRAPAWPAHPRGLWVTPSVPQSHQPHPQLPLRPPPSLDPPPHGGAAGTPAQGMGPLTPARPELQPGGTRRCSSTELGMGPCPGHPDVGAPQGNTPTPD